MKLHTLGLGYYVDQKMLILVSCSVETLCLVYPGPNRVLCTHYLGLLQSSKAKVENCNQEIEQPVDRAHKVAVFES